MQGELQDGLGFGLFEGALGVVFFVGLGGGYFFWEGGRGVGGRGVLRGGRKEQGEVELAGEGGADGLPEGLDYFLGLGLG